MYEKPTLLVDSREKLPLDFDGCDDFKDIKYIRISEGDYSLEGLEHIVSIERKSSPDELYQNLSTKAKKKRLFAEAERLRTKVKYRFIIVEASLAEVTDPMSYYINKTGRNKYSKMMPPIVVMNNLIEFMTKYGIFVIFADKYNMKFIVKKILLNIYKEHSACSK